MSDSHVQDEQPAASTRSRGAAAVCPDRCIRVALRPFHATRFFGPPRPGSGILHHCHGHSFPWLNTSTPCTG
ncbi:hypothetical protein DOT40_10715 [Stutzerimonas stutzeri]|nr:hypothetical protein C6Y58_05855 [Stutzerimonas stutzeri]RAA02299.1 hypothetical protein DOT40_10715 [Stutzerimonas stutzeri]TGY12200.1 hypothetical protein E5834_11100 [Stutzerimonas stutzeri]